MAIIQRNSPTTSASRKNKELKIIYRPNPWNSARRADKVDLIVVHSISDKWKHPEAPYAPDNILRLLVSEHLSYHYLIDRDGSVYELVDPKRKAFHAGVSNLWGQSDLNQNSIGVALAGKKGDTFTDPQYDSFVKLCQKLRSEFTIPLNRIVGHEHVAPGRKVDPGRHFDWNVLDRVAQDVP